MQVSAVLSYAVAAGLGAVTFYMLSKRKQKPSKIKITYFDLCECFMPWLQLFSLCTSMFG